jgi:hypothetical protein
VTEREVCGSPDLVGETSALEFTESPSREQKRGHGKPGRSGPPGNANARTHGVHTLKRAVKELGGKVVDRRTSLGRALAEWRASLISDLGGAAEVTTQQLALIDMAVRTKLLVDAVDTFVLEMGSPVNKKRRSLWPVVRERQSLVTQLQSLLRDLGLERKARDVTDLTVYLAERRSTENHDDH